MRPDSGCACQDRKGNHMTDHEKTLKAAAHWHANRGHHRGNCLHFVARNFSEDWIMIPLHGTKGAY